MMLELTVGTIAETLGYTSTLEKHLLVAFRR